MKLYLKRFDEVFGEVNLILHMAHKEGGGSSDSKLFRKECTVITPFFSLKWIDIIGDVIRKLIQHLTTLFSPGITMTEIRDGNYHIQNAL